ETGRSARTTVAVTNGTPRCTSSCALAKKSSIMMIILREMGSIAMLPISRTGSPLSLSCHARVAESPPHLFRCDGDINVAHTKVPQGIHHGVGDGRGRTDGR